MGFTNITGPKGQWRANTHAGYGATATKVAYFANVVDNFNDGSFSVGNDSTNGCAITILQDGEFSFSFTMDGTAGSGTAGPALSLNATSGATAYLSLIAAQQLAMTRFNGSSGNSLQPGSCGWSGFLPAGSVVRPQTQGNTPDTAAYSQFTVCHTNRY